MAIKQRKPQRAPQGQRTKTGRISANNDPYYIDPGDIPEGMSYQWVARTVIGRDDGKFRMHWTEMARNGWEPVDGSRVPQFGVASGMVDMGGLVLCERPLEMTQEAQQEDQDRANAQVLDQMRRLEDTPSDHLARRDRSGRTLVSIKRDEPIPVREDSDYERQQ